MLSNSEYYQLLDDFIPWGSSTCSKHAVLVPEEPAVIVRGKGCRVWDADGREFIDYRNALGPISLGYCYPAVDEAIEKLLKNIDDIGGIPLNMLRQYMPQQFKHIREGSLINPTARDLCKDKVVEIIDDYNYAVIHSYMTANMF